MPTTRTYPIPTEDARRKADARQLTADIQAALPGKGFRLRLRPPEGAEADPQLDADFPNDDLTTGELATLDAAVNDHLAAFDPLPAYKQTKMRAIDANTDRVAAQGFTYDGKVFGLSPLDLVNILGVDHSRDIVGFGYPITFNTQDGLDSVDLNNSNEVRGFFLTALTAYRTARDSGTALKNQVRAATTIAEVDAVVDNR